MNFTEIDREDFRNLLTEIHRTHMPFGMFGKDKYPPRGVPIFDLPEEYLMWFKQREFPKGRLGELMAHVCEIKEMRNGLPLRSHAQSQRRTNETKFKL